MAERPYLVVYKGDKHMVRATSPAEAARHVVSADISELRPARTMEIYNWMNDGKAIEVAGEKAAPPAPVEECAENVDVCLPIEAAGEDPDPDPRPSKDPRTADEPDLSS